MGQKQWYLWTPRSDMVADSVLGTAMKRHVQRHLMHSDKSPLQPLRTPKLHNTKWQYLRPSKSDVVSKNVLIWSAYYWNESRLFQFVP